MQDSELCLTCGHTEDSHFFVEESYDSQKKGVGTNNCDCEQFRI